MQKNTKLYAVEENSAAGRAVGILNGVLLVAVVILLVVYAVNNIKSDKAVAYVPEETQQVTQEEISGTSFNVITSQTVSETVTTTAATTAATTVTTAETEPKYTDTSYDKDFFANTLFIGDSISTGFSGFGYLETENVFAKVGLNPESALTTEIDGFNAVTKAEAMKPERICIMLGTNGLAFMEPTYMAKKMGTLIEELKAAVPESEIVILSIPPVTEKHESENPEKNEQVRIYNADLEVLAEDNDCVFVDLYDQLTDDKGYFSEDYAEADGLHFLGAAYGVTLSYIEYCVNEAEQPAPAELTRSVESEAADSDEDNNAAQPVIPALPEFADN